MGLLLFAVSATAQMNSNNIAEPVLGWVLDAKTQNLRTLMGIPGASRLGGSIGAGAPLSAVAISSQRAYALALEDGTATAVLISQSGRQPLPGVRAGAQQIALSPNGTAAALFFGDSGKAMVLTGLPEAPQIAREVTLDGPPSLLAVSDDGTRLAAAINLSRNENAVFYYSPDSTGQSLLRNQQFSSLDFVPGGATLLIATDAAVNLYQGQGLQLIADQRDGIANILGAAASGDGAQTLIAMRSGQVAIRNLADFTLTRLSCSCEPSGIWRLRGNAVFRLNELSQGPIWVVDGDAPKSRILFVAMSAGSNQ